jgi:hypothetical protein
LIEAAKKEGVSLNQHMVSILSGRSAEDAVLKALTKVMTSAPVAEMRGASGQWFGGPDIHRRHRHYGGIAATDSRDALVELGGFVLKFQEEENVAQGETVTRFFEYMGKEDHG